MINSHKHRRLMYSASNMMCPSDVECSPLSMNSKIEVYDLTGETPCVTYSIEKEGRKTVRRARLSYNSNDSMDDVSLDASFGSFQASYEFQQSTFSDYDNGLIRQVYADFSLDRLAVVPPSMLKTPPSPPPMPSQPTVNAFKTPKVSHTNSKRKLTGDSVNNGGCQLNMIFDMFQSPDLVQGDNDLSTPLPLTTVTNTLVTQVTFEDEGGYSPAPMETVDSFDGANFAPNMEAKEFDSEMLETQTTSHATTTVQPMQM